MSFLALYMSCGLWTQILWLHIILNSSHSLVLSFSIIFLKNFHFYWIEYHYLFLLFSPSSPFIAPYMFFQCPIQPFIYFLKWNLFLGPGLIWLVNSRDPSTFTFLVLKYHLYSITPRFFVGAQQELRELSYLSSLSWTISCL